MEARLYVVDQLSGCGSVGPADAGEWIDDEFMSINRAGVRTVVSLLEAAEAYELGLQGRRRLLRTSRSGPFPSRTGRCRRASAISHTLRAVYERVVSESTVVHCRAGIGRTGLFAAGVLLHDPRFAPSAAFDLVANAARRPPALLRSKGSGSRLMQKRIARTAPNKRLVAFAYHPHAARCRCARTAFALAASGC